VYYRVTVILENKSIDDPDDLYDEFYGQHIGKGKIVEVESAEEADDFDDENLEDISSIQDS
jgi:hypothetical protein